MKNKFDINTIIGFLLIGGIFLYFGYFNQPDPQAGGDITEEDSTEVVEETRELKETQQKTAETDPEAENVEEDGRALREATGEAEIFTLENDVLELSISSRGGQIVKARIKDYQTYDSIPLYLINENAEFNIQFEDDRVYNTADLEFRGEKSGNDRVTMTLDAGNGRSLQYEYRLEPSNYMLDWNIRSQGMGRMMAGNAGLQWEMRTLRHEKSKENENTYTRVKYRYTDDDDVDELSATGEDNEDEESVKWVAFKQQFFSAILMNKETGFARVGMVSNELEGTEDFTKFMAAKMSLTQGSGDIDLGLGFYLGPNKYEVLKAYGQNFDELIPLGWGILGWINRGIVINVFNWLENYGLNYGIIILIIALLIKIILFPLTYQSYKSMAKMRVLKPEMEELNEKYKDKDPMKKQQAVMELYRKAGVNPLGGCIPVLLQMPILIALFRFFPASIELRQQPFLWAEDLSTYDSIAQLPFHIPFYGDHISLFTLLMTVSTLIYTYMNQQLTGSNQQYPQMKYLVYLMPFMFLGFFNSYAAGLSYYYFVANMITFGQQFAIRSFLDDDKIHAKIEEKKKKPKKENRFMRRMKEIQEEQNRQARRKK